VGRTLTPESASISCMITAFYEVTTYATCMITDKGE
jgi:hypothetical protein